MQTHAPEGFQITLSKNIINHTGNYTAIHKQAPTQTHMYNDIYIERHQSHTHHTYGHTHPHTSKLPSQYKNIINHTGNDTAIQRTSN